MGEVFRQNKSKLIPLVVLALILFSPTDASASGRELELFESGYENYIAYQPEKAVKEFRTFLEEFPQSSAKDAAMFWLGKSLMYLGFLEEARQVFSGLITEFPESPFRGYAERELDIISKTPLEDKRLNSSYRSPERESTIPEQEPEEQEFEEQEFEEQEFEEQEFEEQETEGRETKEEEFEKEETEEEETEKSETSVEEPSNDLSTIAGERDELRPLFEEEKVKSGAVQARAEEAGGKEAYIANSSFVLSRLAVTDVAWRSNDILKDVENEQLLYEKAKSLNISADPAMYRELVEKYHFNSEQAEYLQKFLSICELIDMKLRDRQDGGAVELLVVRYEEGDRYKKITLSTDLQKLARSGVSFEDMSKMHSDTVEFKVVRFQDLEDWIKEKVLYLRNNETGVIWSEDGYMLLKPVAKKRSFNPFEGMEPEMKDRIKASVGELLQDIKGQR